MNRLLVSRVFTPERATRFQTDPLINARLQFRDQRGRNEQRKLRRLGERFPNALWVMSFLDPDGYRVDFESPTGVPEETGIHRSTSHSRFAVALSRRHCGNASANDAFCEALHFF
jgi:hypothetical protein